ncbi:type III pantothenate kinase [uncultured Tepidimonas sp.]|uniref:type III pantothenate kinase n=1 Tax=uncultured Tepidimonas sp. TaxID=453579 RepID=UPI002639C507|nr:type III pantothenate kinase [uncultured Tepidimonas sp.]
MTAPPPNVPVFASPTPAHGPAVSGGTALLALDVGNTRLKWALYEAPRPGARLLAHGVQFLENIETLAEGDWRALRAPHWVLGSIVAGAGARHRVEEQLELWDAPVHWVVPSATEAGLVNGYDHPARLGSDRWVAMIGARQRLLARGQRRPCVVVMVGTAVTVEAIDAEGRFLGGLILPGHGIMLRALESGTAGLHVPTGEVRAFPTNTSDALTSGGTYAIAGAVQRMVDNLRAHTGQEPVCLMTGGAGWKMAPHMTVPFELVEGLIFDGLLAIARERYGNAQAPVPPAPARRP